MITRELSTGVPVECVCTLQISPVSAADNGGLGCADENASSIPTEYDTDEKDKALKALQEKVSKDAHKALHQPWERAHVRISAVESACLPRYSSVRPPVDQMKFAFTCMSCRHLSVLLVEII